MGTMRVYASAPAGVGLLVAASCGGNPEPHAVVAAVVPPQAYNDVPIAVTVEGGPFRPAYRIDTGSGKATLDVGAFSVSLVAPGSPPATRVSMAAVTWKDSGSLGATIPAGLPAGVYDVEVRDQRGTLAAMRPSFRSLGHDGDPPALTVSAPASGTVVAAGTFVPLAMHADDGAGHLAVFEWMLVENATPPTSCPFVPGASVVDCKTMFSVPQPVGVTSALHLQARAQDTAGNATMRAIDLVVALGPQVTSVTPRSGPIAGMTRLAVQGDNFIAGGTQVLIDGVPIDPSGGAIESPTVIRGLTPKHDPGVFQVVVQTGGAQVAAGTFEYIAPPVVRAIDPPTGSPAGDTGVLIAGDHFRAATRIVFSRPSGAVALSCPVWQDEHRIVGYAPPGTGTVTILADDPIGGATATGPEFEYSAPTGREGGVTGGDPEAGAAAMKCDIPDGGLP
jgi:hypothetical protein